MMKEEPANRIDAMSEEGKRIIKKIAESFRNRAAEFSARRYMAYQVDRMMERACLMIAETLEKEVNNDDIK